MKEILEKIFDKKIEYIRFNQYIYVYPEEPSYSIEFVDGSKTVIDLSELIVMIFNSK